MSSLSARTGRLRQRYEDNFRLVSGCIPYRLIMDREDQSVELENTIEVLMVSSPKRDDLVFPKGGWESDETAEEAACREALEEAGVRGILNENPLGVWEFRSKSREDICCLEGGCRGQMFALEVTEELETWAEQDNRERKWLTISEAFELCRYEWMRHALAAFLKVMQAERKPETTKDMTEPSSMPVSDVAAEFQIVSANCFGQPSNSPHHCLSQFSWQIPL